MKWGLVPSWAPDPSIGNQMINARAETLLKKPSFRNLVSQRRCLIPADGFYEWRREGNRKVPVWIHLKKKEPFAFAGLWDSWRNVEVGDTLHTFTIITTEPNSLLEPIHNRMPVILSAADYGKWMDPAIQEPGSVLPLLAPCPDDWLAMRPVSTIVNNARNETPECLNEPAA